jgi:perosamine synthetase
MEKIPVAKPVLAGNELKYISECITTGWISSIGSYVLKFEEAIASFHGMKHGIATSSGTTALHLALAALDIKENDEVIIPDITFIATANAVKYCNAIPKLIDVNADDWNIDISILEKSINENTKAIIPVHIYGNPARMKEIMKIAEKYKLAVIEDCAESFGAEEGNKKTGSFGLISCFSFFGNKIITTGEGGMCLTNDDMLAEKMRMLRGHGMDTNKRYWHTVVGFNYRMTNLQAAIGLAQFEQFNKFYESRDFIFKEYSSILKDYPFIKFQETNLNKNVNWSSTIRISGINQQMRNKIIEDLLESGIESRPFFYPLHAMPPYSAKVYHASGFSVSNMLADEGITLPTFVGMDRKQIKYVCDHLMASIKKIKKGNN